MGKENLLSRISKIKGQITGVEKMLKEDRSCSDMLVQVKAVNRALLVFGEELLKCNIDKCMEENKNMDLQKDKINELIKGVFNWK